MVKALVSDVARVLLFPKDNTYKEELNALYKAEGMKEGFSFFDCFDFNHELLELYKQLPDDLALYIFTSDIIQDAPELQEYWKGIFKEIYSASKMGTHKRKPEAYEMLVKEIGLKPDEIIFIDDNPLNIEAAKKAGLQTIHYLDNKSLEQELKTLLR